MERIVEQGILYDFYGSLLTGHQRAVYEQVVYQDMSLNEIAEEEGISKQAVSDLVKRTTAQMQAYEEKLGMIRKSRELKKLCGKLRGTAEELDCGREKILEIAELIEKEL